MATATPDPSAVLAAINGRLEAEQLLAGRKLGTSREYDAAFAQALRERADEIAPPSCSNASLIAELLEALESLRDWQNGPPTVTHEKQWQAAMELAERAISKARGINQQEAGR